jgi:hypothetical protein
MPAACFRGGGGASQDKNRQLPPHYRICMLSSPLRHQLDFFCNNSSALKAACAAFECGVIVFPAVNVS